MAKRMVYKGSLNGTAPVYQYFPVTDGQTIYAGDIVALDSGTMVLAADAAAAGTVMGVSNTTVIAASSDVIAVDINPASIYEAAYIGASPSIGLKYDMGTAAYKFDGDDVTGGYIQVVGNIDTVAKKADVILCNRVFGLA